MDNSRALLSWRRRAAGLRAHAQPDRAGRECVRRTERAAASPPGPAARTAAVSPRAAALGASAEGSAGRDAGCEAKAGQHARPPSGLRSYAYTGARQSAAQHSRSQRFLAALSLCNGSLAVLSQLSLPLCPSFLVPPRSLPSPCLSAFSPSLSFCLSLAHALPFFFAQFQRLSEPVSLAKRAASEQRARQSQTGVMRAHVYGVVEPFFGPVSASCLSWCRSPCGPLSSCGPLFIVRPGRD